MTPRHLATPEVADTTEPLIIIVVGSFSWTNEAAVHAGLHDLWDTHNGRSLLVVTSGCPQGAEHHARTWATQWGWQTVQVRDEELVQFPSAVVLGFITDPDKVAARLLVGLRARHWVRTLTEDTSRVTSAWVER